MSAWAKLCARWRAGGLPGLTDALVKRLKEAGLQFDTDPADQRWLWREARLRDPSGNPICLFAAGANRLNPPWRIQESLA